MEIIFDVETTGTADFNLPLDHSSHPHIVSICAIQIDEKAN